MNHEKRWIYNVVIYAKRDGRKLEIAKRRTYMGALLFIAKMSKKYSKEFAKARIDGCFEQMQKGIR